jgi:hypothetical protein
MATPITTSGNLTGHVSPMGCPIASGRLKQKIESPKILKKSSRRAPKLQK